MIQNGEKVQGTPPSIVLIDDCPDYRTLLSIHAKSFGIKLTTFKSLADMYSIARLANFDLIILDYQLESWCGIEIARYVDVFFQNIPVVLISSSKIQSMENWPTSIKAVYQKDIGPAQILLNSLDIIEQTQLSQILEKKYATPIQRSRSIHSRRET